MNCEHYSEYWETCTNADCPYCADYCPVTENPEVCRYSGLDDTETMLRERLDEAMKWREDDLHEFTKKVDVLQREIERLKKQLVEVTSDRDAAVMDMEALMWHSGDGCEICEHKVVYQRYPYTRLGCKLSGECKPKWSHRVKEDLT